MASSTKKKSSVEPWPLDVTIARVVEAHLKLRTRHGFGAPVFTRDRAEACVRWERPDSTQIVLTFYGLDRIENLGLSVRPPDRNRAFGLHQLARAHDPALHERFHRERQTYDEAGVTAWAEAHAALFEAHLQDLSASWDQIRAAEPLGPQCEQLVRMARQVLRLEDDHGFDPPTTIHWGHRCEITFARGALRLRIELEDHEKAGVTAEPFTVPELYLLHEGSPKLSLTESSAQRAPDHAAQRPRSDRYAMALEALRPWLEHDAAFLRAHPEVLEAPATAPPEP